MGGKENLQIMFISLEIYGLRWCINYFEITLHYYWNSLILNEGLRHLFSLKQCYKSAPQSIVFSNSHGTMGLCTYLQLFSLGFYFQLNN